MRFWDASAVVPLLLRQKSSAGARTLYRRYPDVAVWWGTAVESASAIARLERAGDLTEAEGTSARTRLVELEEGWTEVEPSDSVKRGARRLLRLHELRAGDAFQLAAALVLADGDPASVPFVCLDARLSAAARREGFPIVEP